jgi:hypothetical protein
MALRPLSPHDLAHSQTLFRGFMGDRADDRMTLGELRAIYRERSLVLRPDEDRADDLRVERFAADMAGGRWTGEVVMRIGEFDGDVLVVDGIHRGIAYLSCIEAGIGPELLPALHVDR